MRHSKRYRFRPPFVMTPEKLEELKKLRAKGLSFDMVADLAGVSRRTATSWLKGKRRFVEIPAARGATWRKEDGHAQGELQAKG